MLNSRNLFRIFLTLLVLIFTSSFSSAAVNDEDLIVAGDDQIQKIVTSDGSKLNGRITNVGNDNITFKTNMGEMKINKADIVSIKTIDIDNFYSGKYSFENPNLTRLYFAPTGRMLKQGQGYINDFYLFFPSIAYGLTDNITLSGGFSIFPGIDMGDQVLFLNPKIGLPFGENMDFALSGLYVRVPEEDYSMGILYAVGTYGTADASVTIGAGFGYDDDEIADKPAIIIGGEYRVSSSVSLVAENWIIPGVDDPMVSGGVRFMGEKMAVDFAVWTFVGETVAIPYLGFIYNF